jgi:hypothetical protein
VIEIEEVLLAIIASGFNILSNDDNTDFLTFAFYTIALNKCDILLKQQNQHLVI